MKLLQETISKLLLEGQKFDDFQDWLKLKNPKDYIGNWEKESKERNLETMHKDHLRKKLHGPKGISDSSPNFERIDSDVDQYFTDRRDIKRYWNENCDREFWQGPNMRYFHSLSYYGHGVSDTLVQNVQNEIGCEDLSLIGFAQQYKMTGNKDEMSTWGVCKGTCFASAFEKKLGVEIEGRVTLAVRKDGMVESRSKATPTDHMRHVGSGLPKRPTTGKRFTDALLFDEEDVKESHTGVGECVLDNWSVKAIWYDPRKYSYDELDGLEAFGDALGIPTGDIRNFIKRRRSK